MSSTPGDRKYAESHEWHRVEGDVVTIGITQFAVNELTDVTFVEMKPKGSKIKAGGNIGEIESVKATSEIYSAVGGEIIETNAALNDNPALINADPYGNGWLIRMKMTDSSALANLMDSSTYDQKNPL